MKDFLGEDLKCKEIPSKPQEKDPYHYHIWDFAYFAYFYRYGHQYQIYLPWKFKSKLFFCKKYGWGIPSPTIWTCPKICIFFSQSSPLFRKEKKVKNRVGGGSSTENKKVHKSMMGVQIFRFSPISIK